MRYRSKTQRDLDDRIAQLELELQDLKRARNALSPISQLPTELLCRILSFNGPTPVDGDFESFPSNPISPTLHYCHVSHTWRTILLKAPQLWSNIQVGKNTTPELLDLMWLNAGSVLVDLVVDISVDRPIAIDALVDTIRQHPAKLRSLQLRLRVESIRRIFEG